MADSNTGSVSQAADRPAAGQSTAGAETSRPAETGGGAEAGGRPRPRRRWWLTVAVLLAGGALLAGAWPAYRWWHQRRTKQFQTACRAAVSEQDWQTLRLAASRWVDWDPGSGDGWVFLAEACVQLDEPERAAECLANVEDDYEAALEALAIRGDLLFSDLNRVYDAVESWQRMLEINHRADLARQRLIYFYAMTLQREKMLRHIRKAMQLNCEPPEAYAYYILAYDVNFSDGLSLLSKWREKYPKDETLEVAHAIYVAKYKPVETIVVPGKLSIAPGDLGPITECLTKYPDNLEVLAFHLDKAVYEGDEQRVLELLKQCPPPAEQDGRFWRFRGWYLAAQKRYREAEEALRKSLEIHPVDWRALWMLAGVLRRLGKTAEASKVAHVALLGKELRQELFELPNARALNDRLFFLVRDYLRETGPQLAQEALRFRLGGDETRPGRGPSLGPFTNPNAGNPFSGQLTGPGAPLFAP